MTHLCAPHLFAKVACLVTTEIRESYDLVIFYNYSNCFTFTNNYLLIAAILESRGTFASHRHGSYSLAKATASLL